MLHGEATRRGEAPAGGLYLAKIPKDRLVCLRTAAGDSDGGGEPADGGVAPAAVLTTIPLAVNPERLRLNVSIAPGGSIRVGLLDPWERPLPGCELEASVPIVEGGVGGSRRRDCHFADALFPLLLKHLLKVEVGAAE